MFKTLTPAPPDPILGLTEAFKLDPNPNKINLGVGVYKDESGRTPILESVKQAEQRLIAGETSKGYLPIDGSAEYHRATQDLIFGPGHTIVGQERVATAHSPGGTGALRVAADFLAKTMPDATVWVSDPTWPNHRNIFHAAGLPVKSYAYFDPATNGLDFEAMLTSLRQVSPGDIVVLHGCCHNPSGVDPSGPQWQQIGTALAERQALPLLDFAYQGFGEGLRADAAGLLTICETNLELLIANSYSKNFGLYNERAGALTVVSETAGGARAALSHVKQAIRANFSNPPAHGGAIVSTILSDPELRQLWEQEVAAMRDRINDMRHLFVETLNQKGASGNFAFITHQRGMFSFSGLTPAQVALLREKFAIYIVSSGRINVAGMTADNMDYLCGAIAEVVNATADTPREPSRN